MALQRLYRSADQLLKQRDVLEAHLWGASKSLFSLAETVTLYDLTNTYFEGTAAGIGKARRGHSKEKRSDCPLVTLALVLDGSGLVMDAGIATAANLLWLKAHGHDYVVVSRTHARQFDPAQAVPVQSAGEQTIQVQRVLDTDSDEALLYCYAPARAHKETWRSIPSSLRASKRPCRRWPRGFPNRAPPRIPTSCASASAGPSRNTPARPDTTASN